MPTSRRNLLLESAAAVAIAVAISALVWPADLGLTRPSMHPAWLAAILLGARYGPAGLFSSLGMVMLVAVGASVAGLGAGDILVTRFSQSADLYPLMCAVAVAWVAMSHQGRLMRSQGQCEESIRRQESQGKWADALHTANKYLQSRCDRIDVSVSLWRWVARSLERGDLTQAADAALLVCMVRSGARAGCVASVAQDGEVVVAKRGIWSCECPLDLANDRTVLAVLREEKSIVARDLSDASECDSDVAVPILDELDGTVLGVIALREVDPQRLRSAEMRDLELLCEWLAPSLARQIKGPRLHAATEQSVEK